MKLNYFQSAKILNVINDQLGDIKGDLALELLELQLDIEDKFKAHTTQLRKVRAELQPIEEQEKETKKETEKGNELRQEILNIYQKEKELDIEPFDFGNDSDRDLKPYLNLNALREMKPILNLSKNGKQKEEEPTE